MPDNTTADASAAPAPVTAAVAAPAAPTPKAAPAPAPEATKAYLTTDYGSYGPRGNFVDLTPSDAAAGLASGILVEPTPDQLKLRAY